MSTNPRTTTQNQAESSTHATAEASSAAYPQSLASYPTTDTSWTQRCQRQFETQSTDQLHNLVDKSNLVIVSLETNH